MALIKESHERHEIQSYLIFKTNKTMSRHFLKGAGSHGIDHEAFISPLIHKIQKAG